MPDETKVTEEMSIRALLILCAAASAAGCVSSDAGYANARSVASSRAGLDARWGDEDDFDVAGARKKILAAPLTANSAVQLAVLSNAQVQAGFARLGIARGRLVRALRLPNPELDGALFFHEDTDAPDIELGATIDLTSLFMIPARESVASMELDAASLEAAGIAMDVALEARVAFLDFQTAQQTRDLRRTVTFAMAQSSEAAQKLLEAQNVPELDALNEQAVYAESRVQLAAAEGDVVTARERLNAAMGLWGAEGARWTVDSRIPDPAEVELKLDDVERVALSKSLDLEIFRKRYAAAAKRIDLAHAEGWVPDIGAGVAGELEQNEEWGVGPRVTVGLPLFYQGQGEVAVAEAERALQQQLHTGDAVRVRSAARALVSRLSIARDRALFYRKTLLPLRERIVAETQRSYNAMGIGVFQLIMAKRDQIETGRAYLEALREYWITRAEVESLTAGRLPPMRATMMAPPAAGAGGEEH